MKNLLHSILFSLTCLLISIASNAQGTSDTIFTLDQKQIVVPSDFIEWWETAFDDRINQPSAAFQAKDFEGRTHSSEMYLGIQSGRAACIFSKHHVLRAIQVETDYIFIGRFLGLHFGIAVGIGNGGWSSSAPVAQ